MADGKIIIDTAINTKGFEEGGRELENAGQKVAASMDEIMRSVNDSFSGIDTKAVAKQFETLDDVVERAMSKIANVATTAGADASEIRSVTIPKSAMGYDQSAIDAIESYSAGISEATQGVNEMLAALKAAEEEVKRLEGVGKFFGDAEYDDAVLKLQKVKADVASYKRELADAPRAEFLDRIAQSAQVADQKIVDLKLELDSLKARQQNLSAAGITYGYEEFDRNAARIAEINRELNTYAKRVSAAEGKNATYTASNTRLGKSLDSSKKKVSGLSKSFKQFSANNALKQGLTSVFKYAFGVQSLFRLFNQIRAYIGEGINNLVQFDGATNKSVSNIKSAMTTLKNSLATAFAPILTVVEPIITRFINMLSTAATYIGYFFAALSGQKTFTRAVAVQEDYAASLNDTASAAGSAADAVKELNNLSGLDEINKFQEATPATSGAGGGGASGGVTPSQMFETVNLEDVFKPIDWKKAGEKVSTGLKTVLDTISTAIDKVDWSSLPGKVSTAITGFFSGFDWEGAFESIGTLIGEAYEAVFEIKRGVFTYIGEQVNKVITYFLDRISPEISKLDEDASLTEIGIAIVKGILKGIIDGLKNIGKWIYKKVLQPFVDGFNKAFEIHSPSKVMQEIGGYIIAGLILGIQDALSDVDTVFLSIWQRVKDTWGNVNRETVTAWTSMKASVKNSLNSIGSNIVSAWGNARQKTAELWAALRSNVAIETQDTYNAISSAWSNAKNNTISAWTAIKNSLSESWNSIRSSASSFFDGGIKSAITTGLSNTKTSALSIADSIRSSLSSAWSTIKSNASTGFTNLKDGVVNIMNSLKNAIKTPINGIIGFLNAMLSGLVSGINSAIRALNKISVTVPSWVPTYGGRTFGFSIKTITAPTIPYLAAGAVIPPNAPFMAMLGDQKRGNNLEAPEGLIRRIVREESGSGGNTYNVSARANGRTIFEMVIEEGKRQQSSTGRNPFELAY